MSDFVLYHGNKNYSSWSMRAWLALKLTGVGFEEVGFHLGEPGVREKIRRHSPTGKVPALQHGDLVIWDSMAIGEYLAEQFPEARLWPAKTTDRALARAICAEMHSGFPALRAHMPFNVRRSSPGKGRTPEVRTDIERVTAIWRGCRERLRGRDEGPFLFGRWCLADVTYAPVVSRFRTYAVKVDEVSRTYGAVVWEQEDVRAWRAAAEAESWVEPQYDL
jgi:glutathione S-transferase